MPAQIYLERALGGSFNGARENHARAPVGTASVPATHLPPPATALLATKYLN